MAALKVLIVGGGIAGPALAHWLSSLNASITLIERSPRMRASGQQIDLRAQGVPLMKKMGIEAAVRAAAVHEPGMQLVDTKGKTVAFFPAGDDGTGKQSFTSEYEIMRGDFVRILYELTEKKTNVRHLFDTTVAGFTQDAESDPNGKVHVSFNDGRKESFDLVVAADGTGSKTRKIMLGPEAPDPRHPLGGGFIGFFSIPSQPQDSNRGTFCHLPGSHVSRQIGTRKDVPHLTRIYMMTRGKDANLDAAYKSGNLAQLKKAWADLYKDGGWECKRFMNELLHAPEADDLYCTPFEEVRLPKGSWSKGRVVLIGDAAHSETANGFGTTWGLVGAYVLAGEIASLYGKNGLSTTEAVVQGAKKYEETFRPIAKAGEGGSDWWNETFENFLSPRSMFAIGLMYKVAAVAAWLRLDQRIGFEGKTSKWQLPEYPELNEHKV